MWPYNTCLTQICLQNGNWMNWKCFLKTSASLFTFALGPGTNREVFLNFLKSLTIPRPHHTCTPCPLRLKVSSACLHLANPTHPSGSSQRPVYLQSFSQLHTHPAVIIPVCDTNLLYYNYDESVEFNQAWFFMFVPPIPTTYRGLVPG